MIGDGVLEEVNIALGCMAQQNALERGVHSARALGFYVRESRRSVVWCL